jgi:hypothetical protein
MEMVSSGNLGCMGANKSESSKFAFGRNSSCLVNISFTAGGERSPLLAISIEKSELIRLYFQQAGSVAKNTRRSFPCVAPDKDATTALPITAAVG